MDTLRDWSEREPILIFVEIMVDQNAGAMAFENTYSTRWHINVDIPEMKATLERVKNIPYEIELRKVGQSRQGATDSTISALSGLDPSRFF